MNPERLAAFANVIAGFCQEAAPGETVLVEANTATLAEGRAVATALSERGALPKLVNLDVPDDLAASRELTMWQELTGYVSLRTIGAKQEANGMPTAPEIRHLRMTLRKTTTYLPDQALADRAGLTLQVLEDYYAGLLHLDEPDPVAGFHRLRDEQEALLSRLRQAREVRLEGNGTDLTLSTAGRGWVNSYGRRNIPSGEMYTSPVETSANGVVYFDVPSYNFPEPVRGVTLEFNDGEVVHAAAEEGSATLKTQLQRDTGARRLGELGIGGNRRMSRFLGATLFDEKVAGSVHLALGKSYPQTGGLNDSSLHWDLIKDLRSEGRLSLDGEPFIVDGGFVVNDGFLSAAPNTVSVKLPAEGSSPSSITESPSTPLGGKE